jgi:hypothetical protein
LEKRGKPPLLLPLPKPNPLHRGPGSSDIPSEIVVASVSSNCSADSEDRADSQLQSPVGNDTDNVTKVSSKNKSRYTPEAKNTTSIFNSYIPGRHIICVPLHLNMF